MSEVVAGTGQKQHSTLETTLCSNRRPSTPWSPQLTLMYYAFWRCVLQESSFWRGVTLTAVLGNLRTWHTAHCLSWTQGCIQDGTIGVHQCTVKCAGHGVTVPKWLFAISAWKGIIFGVWIPPLWRCLVERGRVTNTKVNISHFITVIWDILKHGPDKHNKHGEILFRSATLW